MSLLNVMVVDSRRDRYQRDVAKEHLGRVKLHFVRNTDEARRHMRGGRIEVVVVKGDPNMDEHVQQAQFLEWLKLTYSQVRRVVINDRLLPDQRYDLIRIGVHDDIPFSHLTITLTDALRVHDQSRAAN